MEVGRKISGKSQFNLFIFQGAYLFQLTHRVNNYKNKYNKNKQNKNKNKYLPERTTYDQRSQCFSASSGMRITRRIHCASLPRFSPAEMRALNMASKLRFLVSWVVLMRCNTVSRDYGQSLQFIEMKLTRFVYNTLEKDQRQLILSCSAYWFELLYIFSQRCFAG